MELMTRGSYFYQDLKKIRGGLSKTLSSLTIYFIRKKLIDSGSIIFQGNMGWFQNNHITFLRPNCLNWRVALNKGSQNNSHVRKQILVIDVVFLETK